MDAARRAPRLRRGAAAVLALSLLLPVALDQRPARAAKARNISMYRGLGSWVDIFDTAQLNRPVATVKAMKARGVRTIYFETSNFSQARAIVHKGAAIRFIHAAHARGMKVVAWYLPGFQNLRKDKQRSMAAIRFRTPRGERFDSFALDIESSHVSDPAKRSRRTVMLSRFLRNKAAPRYPLGGIIPSPRGMQLAKGYWPGFPYEQLGKVYDVILPMGYWTYRVKGNEAARDYTTRNSQIIRRKTGRPSMPIHAIGGISGDASGGEVRGFVRSVREHGLLGASMYAFDGARPSHWTELANVPVNPRQKVPLPAPLSYDDPLGNVPGADSQHPKEVAFKASGRAGVWDLSFEGFDVQAGEVQILVNWKPLADVPVTLPDGWGGAVEIEIPDRLLKDGARNHIHFVADGDFPSWSEWGVRNVDLSPA